MRDIRVLGDPVLRTRAEPVTDFDRELRRLIDEMFEAMYAVQGVGLAAPQIGVSRRLFVYDIAGRKGHVANPVLTVDDPEDAIDEEGCLSVPDRQTQRPIYAPVARAAGVTVEGLDRLQRPVRVKARGSLARCLQHETEHLDGKLYVDRLPRNQARSIMLRA